METMLTKFESKSNRVKGISFHSVRPWILASLHNGVIQLWDYRMGTLLDKFEEHDGPVRGVDFHKVQPLFTSGGDDYKVKVWDYKLRRCLFTLLGHLDYIRTVQFHHEYPWIISSSDDQTIRLWNWQSRGCISVLTGHNHYVMCALFHPKNDMIVSASLDQTVRVWDTTGLRNKSVRAPPSMNDENTVVARVNNELFGGNDAVVKYVLEGHERGANWASFHPTLPLVVSGADDRQVKIWRMNETKAWEVDTMRGHLNNVSCVIFHPKHELIISNSEDRTIKVWDISKRLCVQTFRRESDRFWVLAAHPEQNLLAAGHDSGLSVFKLERERPPFDCVGGNKCYYVKERYLRVLDYQANKDTPLASLRRTSISASPGIGGGPKTLHYNVFNKAEQNILIVSDNDNSSYELITLSGDTSRSTDSQDVRRGVGSAAVFIARDRFVVLSVGLSIYNFENVVLKRIYPAPLVNLDGIFPGGSVGRIILRSADRVMLYDVLARKVYMEQPFARVKYVIWNRDFSMVAILSKHQVYIADKNLNQLCTVSETIRLKGGCWDDEFPIFIYATLNHLKYALTNGDKGILRGLDIPIYVVRAFRDKLYCIDRELKSRVIEIDTVEAKFKLALERRDYPEVMKIVKHSRICGQAIITYLQDKGFPEVALHFVHDPKIRFKLALACGNIQVAMNVAHDLGDEAWKQLGTQALRQGNHEVVEMSYQKTKDFEKLSFLYLLTGNVDKLRKMLKIADMRGDVMSRFHNSLYLGDVEERIKIFEYCGQFSLAYLSAVTHNLLDDASRLKTLLEQHKIPIPNAASNAELLQPPTPIMKGENWPLLAVSKSTFNALDGFAAVESGVRNIQLDDNDRAEEGTNGWGGDDDLFDDEDKEKVTKTAENTKAGGWGDDDLDLSDDEETTKATTKFAVSGSAHAIGITPGVSPKMSWCTDSSLSADHMAAGSVDSALQLLGRQIALSNPSALRQHAIATFLGARSYLPGISCTPSSVSYLLRDKKGGNVSKPMPAICLRTGPLLESLKQAYKSFTSAQFDDCKNNLEKILHSIPLVVVSTKNELNDVKEFIEVCREYITAIRVKNCMNETEDPGRKLELAAYFTHCNLQPSHIMLALNTAMANAFKSKNFVNAASFARRLLELPDTNTERHAETRSKAQKVLQKSEQQGRNEYSIDYDEMNPFNIDCNSLKPIYKGTTSLKCAYCGSNYAVTYKGKQCQTCNMCKVGIETIGLVVMSANRSKS